MPSDTEAVETVHVLHCVYLQQAPVYHVIICLFLYFRTFDICLQGDWSFPVMTGDRPSPCSYFTFTADTCLPGDWSFPVMTGDRPSPCSYFTFTAIDSDIVLFRNQEPGRRQKESFLIAQQIVNLRPHITRCSVVDLGSF